MQATKQPSSSEKEALTIDEEYKKELAFQEAAVDLTIDDIVGMQYEVAEGEEGTLMEGLADEDTEDMLPADRRVAILLELLQAQPFELEAKISQFVDEIDFELLELLRPRLETARKISGYDNLDPSSTFAVSRLEDLYRALKVVCQRSEASPAMRLLDDLLEILGGDDSESQGQEVDLFRQRERNQEAARRMRGAFCGGLIESPEGIDIFSAARALAEGGPLAAAELSVEFVSQVDFISEATELLAGAREQQRDLEREIERAKRELGYARKRQSESGQMDPSATMATVEEQIRLAEIAYKVREEGVDQLEVVITMARQLATEDKATPEIDEDDE